MYPQKERPILQLAEPCECVIHDIAGAALDGLVAIHAVAAQMEAGVVDFESAIEAGSCAVQRIENQGADEGSGVVTLGMQEIRQVRETWGERNAEVVDA